MTNSETDTSKTEAELRIARVQALSNADLLGVVTYLLAKYPDTFPGMLDDALSSVSPKNTAWQRPVVPAGLPAGPGLAGGLAREERGGGRRGWSRRPFGSNVSNGF